VRAVLVELGALTSLTVQWRRAIDMVSQRDAYKVRAAAAFPMWSSRPREHLRHVGIASS
jgi:hypothetical protein